MAVCFIPKFTHFLVLRLLPVDSVVNADVDFCDATFVVVYQWIFGRQIRRHVDCIDDCLPSGGSDQVLQPGPYVMGVQSPAGLTVAWGLAANRALLDF
jgi:hypothetical protein